jgi:hypothetical protein
MATKKLDLVDRIMAYESDELDAADTLELFSELVKSGAAWSLQGFYGRAAAAMIDAGYLTPDGEITDYAREVLEEA